MERNTLSTDIKRVVICSQPMSKGLYFVAIDGTPVSSAMKYDAAVNFKRGVETGFAWHC